METDPHVQERPNHKSRHVAYAVVLCIAFASILIIRKHLPGYLEKRQNQSRRDDFNYTVDESAVGVLAGAKSRPQFYGILRWGKNVSRHLNRMPFNSYVLTTASPEVTGVVGWERGISRDTATYVEPLNDTTIIPGKEVCGNRNITLVIVVTTAPSSFSRRALIRETWGSHSNRQVRVGFLVGLSEKPSIQKSLEDENNRFQDIIQENLVDTYNNLTLKSIALLKWYLQNCRNSSFLMKSDADTFVNVDLLVNKLANYNKSGILMGYLCPKCGIRRRANQAWAVPRYMYPNTTYPDFLYGGAYIMTRDVAAKLFAAAFKTPVFYLEDVYITGFCAQEAGITPKQFPGSSTYVYEVKKICTPNLATCHPIYPDDMRYLWRTRGDPKYRSLSYSQHVARRFHGMTFFSFSNSPSYMAVEMAVMWIPLINAV